MTLFDFSKDCSLNQWYVVDDVVMGGRSNSTFSLNDDGHAVFEGKVSLENNGGFSSVRYDFPEKKIGAYANIIIHLKGDGKPYQFRVKSDTNNRESYVYTFQTTQDWQVIEIPMREMMPTFRGRKLDMPSYPAEKMEEIAFLIGNKKPETFKLEIDQLYFE